MAQNTKNVSLRSFQNVLRQKKLDCALFVATDSFIDKSICYLTGISIGVGFLLVYPNKKPVLYVTPLEHVSSSLVRVKTIEKRDEMLSLLKGNVGLNFAVLPKRSYDKLRKKGVKYVDVSDDMLKLREVKTSKEVAIQKKAVSITESIFRKVFSGLKKGEFSTEKQVADFMFIETLKSGCTLAFDTIVASGSGAASPHYVPSGKLKKGFCVIDFGVRYKGYCSDMTRTVYLGKPSKKEVTRYTEVLSALKSVESDLIPGKKYSFDKFPMIHALGHGVGLDVHEQPALGKEFTLVEGNVVAIEPGQYVKGKFGIRIEDNYVVRKSGLVRLGKLSRKIRVF